MKRITSILLLIGLCLPVLFEGCKKPENDPVGPSVSTDKDSSFFSTIYIGCAEPSGKKGLVLLYLHQEKIKGLFQPVEIIGADYLRFSYTKYDEIYSTLQIAHAAIMGRSSGLQKYSTSTEFWEDMFRSKPGFVKRQSLNKEQATKLIEQKTILLASHSASQKVSHWTDYIASILTAFVTPALAQSGVEARSEGILGYGTLITGIGLSVGSWWVVSAGATTSIGGALLPASVALVSPALVGGLIVGTAFAGGIALTLFSADAIVQGIKDKAKNATDQLKGLGGSGNNGYGRPRSAAGSQNDPMIVGLDGNKQLLHPAGEFWAIHSKNDEFAVQVRFEPVVNASTANQTGASTTTSIAVRMGKDVVSITVKPLSVHINGQEIKADFTGTQLLQDRGYMTRPSANQYMITTTWGDLIEVRTNPAFNLSWYVRTLSSKRKNQVEGLLGQFNDNPDDDFQDKSGQIFRPPLTSSNRTDWYTKFCGDWRIKQAESILVYAAGKNTDTYTIADYPFKLKHVSIFDFDLAARNKAEQTCRRAGIIHESDLSDCMLDVLITGHDEMADQMALGIRLKEESATHFQRLAEFSGKAAEGAVGIPVGDKIYAGLGKTSVDWAMYDPATDQWTAKTPFPNAKTSFGYCGTFVIGTKIYFVGGAIDNTRTDQLWEYDVPTDKWTQRKSIPGGARYNIAAFSAAGKGYALFGVTGWGLGETDYPTKSATYEYDPATDSWTQKGDFPAKPRGNNITNTEFNGIVTSINGRPFVGGGSGSGTVWNDWYEYIPSQNAWQKRANSFSAKYYCSIGTTFYAISDRYVQSYDATSDTWTKFPGKEIYSPLQTSTLRGIYQLPVVNGKAYLGLGTGTNGVANKEWWSFTP